MPGPRQDKKRAWQSLEHMLDQFIQVARIIKADDLKFMDRQYEDDLTHAVNVLKASGRLDAKQVWFVKKLCEAVWRLKWPMPNNG